MLGNELPEQMVVGAEGKKQQKLLILHCTKSSVGGMGAVLGSEPPGPGPYRDRTDMLEKGKAIRRHMKQATSDTHSQYLLVSRKRVLC